MVRARILLYSLAANSAQDIVKLSFPLFKNLDREHVVVVGLNTKLIPTVINIVSIGTLDSSLVNAREVFKPLILSNSQSFVILHNHVTGDVRPSHADEKITERLQVAGKIMQIELLDHIVVGINEKTYLSFKQEGLFKTVADPLA